MTFMEWAKSLFTEKPKAQPPLANVNPIKEVAAQKNPLAKPSTDKEAINAIKIAHEIPKNYAEAKKHDGLKEESAEATKLIAPWWKKLWGINYFDLKTSAHAWCGLTIGAFSAMVGMQAIKGGAAAKAWANYGQEIRWQVNGIPQGAVIHINHNAKCGSGSSNHVTWSDGDYTAEELKKSGATFNGFGGNQGNQLKTSSFPVAHICEVRWPSEMKLPAKIVVSNHKAAGKGGQESTR